MPYEIEAPAWDRRKGVAGRVRRKRGGNEDVLEEPVRARGSRYGVGVFLGGGELALSQLR